MGKISDFLGNKIRQASTQAYNYGVKKRNEYMTEQKRRREINQQIKHETREAYNKQLKISSIARAESDARRDAWERGSRPRGLVGYAESFSRAGEEMFGFGTMPKNIGKPDKDYYSDMISLPVQPRQRQRSHRSHHKHRRH